MRCVMLNKKETIVMREIYKRSANNNGVCYIRPVDLMAGIPYNIALEKDDIAPILQGLAYDEYFDVEEVVKDGEYTLFIKLLKKGFAFQRSEEVRLRNRKNSIITKVALALLGVGVAWILKYIIQLIQAAKGG